MGTDSTWAYHGIPILSLVETNLLPGLVNIQKLWKMAIEIVDLPIKNGDVQ
jgi:hypothetical protein